MESQQYGPYLPYLRRYARAVTGSRTTGDTIVVETLRAMLDQDKSLPVSPRLQLYHSFIAALNSPAHRQGDQDYGADGGEIVDRHLARLTPRSRQVLLLWAMEGFSLDDMSIVFDAPADVIREMLDDALRELDDQMATDVLIIEDEPVIAIDLQELVESMGHRVIGAARTKSEAVAIAQQARPGLILADIQLADRSSGLDAVQSIMQTMQAPVIFITAFPETLLTGAGAEPTYVLTKPFNHKILKATISQALFFGDAWARPHRQSA